MSQLYELQQDLEAIWANNHPYPGSRHPHYSQPTNINTPIETTLRKSTRITSYVTETTHDTAEAGLTINRDLRLYTIFANPPVEERPIGYRPNHQITTTQFPDILLDNTNMWKAHQKSAQTSQYA